MRIRVYYEDTDCGGIVYHTNYIKYCERARSEIFFRAGLMPSSGTCGFVVSSIEAKFLGLARLGDVLEVRTELVKLGKVQMILRQKIYKLESGLGAGACLGLDSGACGLSLDSSSGVDSALDFAALGEVCIFEAIVRLGFVDVVSQSPAAIPAEFAQLLESKFLDSNYPRI